MQNGTLDHVGSAGPVADEIDATVGLLLRVWSRTAAGQRPEDALDAVLFEECTESTGA